MHVIVNEDRPPLYTGSDDEDDLENLKVKGYFVIHDVSIDDTEYGFPNIPHDLDEYPVLCKLW